MKKMLFSAIAMVAFAGSASAQVQTVTIIKASDKDYCNKKADEYVNNQEGLSPAQATAQRKAYYDGCIAGRSVTTTRVFSEN